MHAAWPESRAPQAAARQQNADIKACLNTGGALRTLSNTSLYETSLWTCGASMNRVLSEWIMTDASDVSPSRGELS